MIATDNNCMTYRFASLLTRMPAALRAATRRLAVVPSVVLLAATLQAGPASADDDLARMIARAKAELQAAAQAIADHAKAAQQMIDPVEGRMAPKAVPKAPATSDAAAALGGAPGVAQASASASRDLSAMSDVTMSQQMRLQMYMDAYSKTFEMLSNISKKVGQTQNTVIHNMGGGPSAAAPPGKPGSNIAAEMQDIRRAADQIEKAQKAASAQFVDSVARNWASLTTKITGGPSPTDLVSRKGQESFQASLSSASTVDIMALTLIIIAQTHKQDSDDLRSQRDEMRKANEQKAAMLEQMRKAQAARAPVELKLFLDTASNVLKIQQANEQIDRGMNEAREKADIAMDAATTGLVLGIAQGLIQIGDAAAAFKEVVSKNPEAFRSPLATANVMEALITAYNVSIEDASGDTSGLAGKLRQTQVQTQIAVQRAQLAINVAHTATTIAYLGKLIDINTAGAAPPLEPVSADSLHAVAHEYLKLVQRESRDDRELARQAALDEMQRRNDSLAGETSALIKAMAEAKTKEATLRHQNEMRRLQSLSAENMTSFKKTLDALEEAKAREERPVTDFTRLPSMAELEALQRAMEAKKRLEGQRQEKNRLIAAYKDLAAQAAALEAEASILAGDCGNAQQQVNALKAAAAEVAKAAAQAAAAKTGSWIGSAIGGPVGAAVGTAVGAAVGGAVGNAVAGVSDEVVQALLSPCRELEEIHQKMAALQAKLDTIAMALAELERKIKVTLAEIQKAKEDFDAAQKEVERRREMPVIATLTQRTEAAKRIAELNRQQEQKKQKELVNGVNGVQHELQRIADEIAALEKQLAQAEGDCDDKKSKGPPPGKIIGVGLSAMAGAQGGGSGGTGGGIGDAKAAAGAATQQAGGGIGDAIADAKAGAGAAAQPAGGGVAPGGMSIPKSSALTAPASGSSSSGSGGNNDKRANLNQSMSKSGGSGGNDKQAKVQQPQAKSGGGSMSMIGQPGALALAQPVGRPKPDPCKEVERLKAEIARLQGRNDQSYGAFASLAREVEETHRKQDESERMLREQAKGSGGFDKSKSGTSSKVRQGGKGSAAAGGGAYTAKQSPDGTTKVNFGDGVPGKTLLKGGGKMPSSGGGAYTAKPSPGAQGNAPAKVNRAMMPGLLEGGGGGFSRNAPSAMGTAVGGGSSLAVPGGGGGSSPMDYGGCGGCGKGGGGPVVK